MYISSIFELLVNFQIENEYFRSNVKLRCGQLHTSHAEVYTGINLKSSIWGNAYGVIKNTHDI